MKKILFSSGIIVVAVGMLTGATLSFLSDTETSSGNSFTSGQIDLLIDNTSYYNGQLNEGSNWSLSNLDDHLFFNFGDLKPGDNGEDTVSLHVQNNDAWACMSIDITARNENGINEPEQDAGDITDGEGAGELQDEISFIWWADDGDNVLESDETSKIFYQDTLGEMSTSIPLSDSSGTGILKNTPLLPNTDYFIGSGWCFGDMSITPLPQDSNEGPLVRGGGFTCDGSQVGNMSQSDSVEGAIHFTAVQSRNNGEFTCNPVISEGGIIQESFNAYTDGTLTTQSDWFDRENGSYYVIQDSLTHEGAKSLYNNNPGADSIVTKTGSQSLPSGKQSFYVQTENRDDWGTYNLGENVQLGLFQGSWDGPSRATLAFMKDGTVAYLDLNQNKYVSFDTYTDNTWVLAEIEWREIDQTARYRVNNGAWTGWMPFTGGGSFVGFDTVGFVTFNLGSGGVYFDTLE